MNLQATIEFFLLFYAQLLLQIYNQGQAKNFIQHNPNSARPHEQPILLIMFPRSIFPNFFLFHNSISFPPWF